MFPLPLPPLFEEVRQKMYNQNEARFTKGNSENIFGLP